MLKPSKTKNPNQLRIGSDLTPSQLVLAICVFLCAALICFSLGVIVGKYDERNNNKEKDRMAAGALPQETSRLPLATSKVPPVKLPGQNTPAAKPDAAPPAAGQGVQTSPRPIVMPGKPGYPGSPDKDKGAVQAGPRVSEHPAPPKPLENDTKPQEPAPAPPTPPAEPAKPAADVAAKEAPKTEVQPAPAGQPPDSAPDAAKPPVADAPKPDAPKTEVASAAPKQEPQALEPVAAANAAAPAAPAAPATPAAPVTPAAQAEAKKGLYTIQLAALTSPTRKEQALAMKKKLEKDGLQPELLISKDGARVAVVVGSYPDRRTAQEACNDLRTNKGFSDCFVRTR